MKEKETSRAENETLGLIKRFMLKNHIEYFDEDGYNNVIYSELAPGDEKHDVALDLTPLYEVLLNYGEELLEGIEWSDDLEVEYIKYFYVDMDSEKLGMEVQWPGNDITRMTIG